MAKHSIALSQPALQWSMRSTAILSFTTVSCVLQSIAVHWDLSASCAPSFSMSSTTKTTILLVSYVGVYVPTFLNDLVNFASRSQQDFPSQLHFGTIINIIITYDIRLLHTSFISTLVSRARATKDVLYRSPPMQCNVPFLINILHHLCHCQCWYKLPKLWYTTALVISSDWSSLYYQYNAHCSPIFNRHNNRSEVMYVKVRLCVFSFNSNFATVVLNYFHFRSKKVWRTDGHAASNLLVRCLDEKVQQGTENQVAMSYEYCKKWRQKPCFNVLTKNFGKNENVPLHLNLMKGTVHKDAFLQQDPNE